MQGLVVLPASTRQVLQVTDAGATVTDPVCGMSIDPHTAAGHATHEGVDYSFCSDDCQTDFLADPAHYLTPTGSG